MERFSFSSLRGFMKAFMDMVFRFEDRYYLVDWKSNFLGASVEDYSPENLTKAMEENFYTLQYTFYTLAPAGPGPQPDPEGVAVAHEFSEECRLCSV